MCFIVSWHAYCIQRDCEMREVNDLEEYNYIYYAQKGLEKKYGSNINCATFVSPKIVIQ